MNLTFIDQVLTLLICLFHVLSLQLPHYRRTLETINKIVRYKKLKWSPINCTRWCFGKCCLGKFVRRSTTVGHHLSLVWAGINFVTSILSKSKGMGTQGRYEWESKYFKTHYAIRVLYSSHDDISNDFHPPSTTESWHSWFSWSLILLYLLSSDGICLTRHCATLTYQNYFNSTTRYRQALVLHVYSNGNIMKAWNRESHSHSLNAKGISGLDVLYSLWNMNMNIRSQIIMNKTRLTVSTKDWKGWCETTSRDPANTH